MNELCRLPSRLDKTQASLVLCSLLRQFREMAEAGLPAPEYRQNEFMVYATIRQHGDAVTTEKTTEKTTELDIGEPKHNDRGVGSCV